MREYLTKEIRNVLVLGHSGSGKTSFGESSLFVSKAIEKKGEVERKNTVGDYTVEEQNRQTTLTSSLLPAEWNGKKINFLDTPGSEEFVMDLENGLTVCDGALIMVDATKGVEVGTERVWHRLRAKNIPTIIVINKMDKENVKYENVLNNLKNKLSPKAVEFTLPILEGDDFVGLVDIMNKNAYIGEDCKEVAIPEELGSQVEESYNSLLENVAESSEELLDKFFGGEELTAEDISWGLGEGLKLGDLYPVISISSSKNIGITTVLNMIVDYLPSRDRLNPKMGIDPRTNEEVERICKHDHPISGYIFKIINDPFKGIMSFFKLSSGILRAGQEVYIAETGETVKMPEIFTLRGKTPIPLEVVNAGDIACVAKVDGFLNMVTFSDKKNPIIYPKVEYPTPVIYIAINPKKKQDEDKISSTLMKLKIEDDTFVTVRNPETAQLLIGGQGLTHINYIIEKMKNTYKVEVDTSDQKIVYRETIRSKGEAQGRHKKQSGGAGQFGDVWIRFEPTDENFVFEEVVVGGSVPKNYFPAVEKGLIETMEHGPLARFPVIGVKATLYDGSYHPVDSNEISFKLAASLAFRNALEKLRPTILEPILQLNIFIKDEFVGDITGDITKRRGRVLGMEQTEGYQEIIAEVPEAEVTRYSVDLKAMTQGSGHFSRKFVRYDIVPDNLVQNIIDEYKK